MKGYDRPVVNRHLQLNEFKENPNISNYKRYDIQKWQSVDMAKHSRLCNAE